MKYLKYFLFLLLFPTIVFAKVNSLEVVSVEMEEKSDDVIEVEEPKVEGSSLTFNNRFYEVDDYIQYKIIMNNVSDEDIKISRNRDLLETKYFSYEIIIDGEDEIYKDEQIEVTLVIKYFENVLNDDITSGHYVESQSINIGMVNGEIIVSDKPIEDVILPENPLTRDVIIILILIAIISGVFLIVFKNKRMAKYSLSLLLLIPLYISAAGSINVVSSVEIKLVKPNPCTYEGELVNNAVYTKEEYKYVYDESLDGWKLVLIDKDTTEPVTSRICTEVNGKPIVSMNGTFASAKTTAIDLSSFDTSNVVDMSGMFYNATNLEEVDLITFDVRNVESLSAMFYGDKISEYNLSGFETPNLKNIGAMFYGNQNLEELDVSMFDTSNVTNMNSFIGYTPNLRKLNISNWDFSNYDLSAKFANIMAGPNSGIKELVADNVNFGTSMSALFLYLEDVESISLKNADTSNVTTMESAFKGLNNIEEMDLSGWDTSKVTNWSNAFVNMPSLKKISFKGTTYNSTNNVIFKTMTSGSPVEELDFEDATLTGSLDSAFYQMQDLKKINFKNVDTHGVTSMSYTFRECPNIEELDLSDFDTENVTRMTWMLGYMPKLTKVDVTGFDLSSGPDLTYMFGGTALKTLDLSSWDVSHLTSMPWGLVYDTTTIEEINLSGWDMRNIGQYNMMGRMIGGSSYALAGGDYDLHYILKKLDCTNCILPNSIGIFQYMPSVEEIILTNVDTSNMTTMLYMFAGARNLKSLDLSSFDTSNVTDMRDMFNGTTLLQELDLSSFDISNVTQSTYMFNGTGATVGYAKDQESADFFNNIAPNTLRFTVK